MGLYWACTPQWRACGPQDPTQPNTHTHTQSVLLIPPSLPAILHFLSPFHFLTSHSLSSSFLSGSFHHHSTKSSPSRPHTTLILLTMESLSPLPSWHTFSFGCQDAFLMPEGPRSTLGPLLFTLHIHTFDDIVQLITWNVIYLTIPTFVFLAQISLWLQPQIQMPTQHWHLGVDNLNSTTLKRNSFSFLFLVEGLSQYCVGFYHTSTWTSHRYTCAPSLLNIPPPPTLSHPSRWSQNPGVSSLNHTAYSHWVSILHRLLCMFPCYSLH